LWYLAVADRSFKTPLIKSLSTPDVYDRSPVRIPLGLAQNFVGDRGRIALTERDVFEKIRNRIAFAPTEIHVRKFSSLVSQIE
jgi:hypothetical protein